MAYTNSKVMPIRQTVAYKGLQCGIDWRIKNIRGGPRPGLRAGVLIGLAKKERRRELLNVERFGADRLAGRVGGNFIDAGFGLPQ